MTRKIPTTGKKLQREYAIVQRTDLLPLNEADRENVQRLAADLPALWHAATTTPVDRKRLLRLVVTEVTLTMQPERRGAAFRVLWCGGAITEHVVNCPPAGIHQRTEANILDRLTALARQQPGHQVAERLNAEGLRTRTGKKWTYARVDSMRKQHAISTGCPLVPHRETKRADGFISSKVAAERLQISPSLVNLWVRHGVLRHDQRVAVSKVWVQLSEEDFARLTGASPEATSLPTLKSIREQNRLTPYELWHQISLGHYLPYRVRRGQTWEWRLKKVPPWIHRS